VSKNPCFNNLTAFIILYNKSRRTIIKDISPDVIAVSGSVLWKNIPLHQKFPVLSRSALVSYTFILIFDRRTVSRIKIAAAEIIKIVLKVFLELNISEV